MTQGLEPTTDDDFGGKGGHTEDYLLDPGGRIRFSESLSQSCHPIIYIQLCIVYVVINEYRYSV